MASATLGSPSTSEIEGDPGRQAVSRSGVPWLASRRSQRPDRRLRRLEAPALAVAIGLTAILVKLVWPRFTWFGDNAESFFPLWHMVGTALRHGQWLGFDPHGFAGGNLVGEANYGLFNPVTLADAVLVSFFDELARASFLVVTQFLILLGLGVRLLALAYGARRSAAFAAGLIVPFGGFTLYLDAGNWACGLMAITWVTWTWWAARRYTTDDRGPLALVICGGLAVTVGYPYALLGVVVVLIGAAAELLRVRRFRRLGGLVLAGLCVGGITALTYLPLVAALPMGYRDGAAGISNLNYMSPSVGDLLGLSSPSLLPEINAWRGPIDVAPTVYLSWIVLPLLPWVRWRSTGNWPARLGLLVPTGLFLAFTLGPDRLWMFRWPLRMLEYSWVGLIVCFALLLSAGLARDHVRRRAVLSAVVVSCGLFFAWSNTPQEGVMHLGWTVAVGSLVALTVAAVRRFGLRALPALLVLATLVITPAQAAVRGWEKHPVVPDLDLGRVSNLATVRAASSTFRGTVYQLSNVYTLTDSGATMGGRLTYGNTLAAAGYTTVNHYTGIGYTPLMEALELDYRSSLQHEWKMPWLYRKVPGYGVPLVDLLGIDTLVVAAGEFQPDEYRPSAGWHTVLTDGSRTVLRRDAVPASATRITPSVGVDVLRSEDVGTGVRLVVRSGNVGGTVVINRPAWPGYRAVTDDGRPVTLTQGPLGLVQLTVPQGTTGIHLVYEVPGLRLGLAAALGGLCLAALQQFLWWRRRTRPGLRRRGDGASAEFARHV